MFIVVTTINAPEERLNHRRILIAPFWLIFDQSLISFNLIFGFAVYLNAGLDLLALLHITFQHSLFASLKLASSLDLVRLPQSGSLTLLRLLPSLGTSFHFPFICLHPIHASGGDAKL